MFEKIKNWIKEYQPLIIGLLLLVIICKGYISCQNEKGYEYKEIQYENIIDSMQVVIDERSIDTKDLCDTIHSLRAENTVLKEVIKNIITDKKYYNNISDNTFENIN